MTDWVFILQRLWQIAAIALVVAVLLSLFSTAPLVTLSSVFMVEGIFLVVFGGIIGFGSLYYRKKIDQFYTDRTGRAHLLRSQKSASQAREKVNQGRIKENSVAALLVVILGFCLIISSVVISVLFLV